MRPVMEPKMEAFSVAENSNSPPSTAAIRDIVVSLNNVWHGGTDFQDRELQKLLTAERAELAPRSPRKPLMSMRRQEERARNCESQILAPCRHYSQQKPIPKSAELLRYFVQT